MGEGRGQEEEEEEEQPQQQQQHLLLRWKVTFKAARQAGDTPLGM